MLGRNLRAIRKYRRINQEVLAAMAGIDTTTLGNIERATANPRFSTITLLAEALGVRWVDLARDDTQALIEELRTRQ
ncbi:MAG: helix-turn-helix transcriptional regulator [Pseudomonadota bacterium]